tara:strand:+ start:2254 stop:2655 length:402 start_codon:yes stop_codon:yes gene_type:complete
MKNKDLNRVAAIENAISKKYGQEAVHNIRGDWNPTKEEEYLQQMRECYSKIKKNEEHQEKIDINGIKISKKLLNREPLKNCPICGTFPQKSMDDVCFIKFDCCHNCYVQYVEDREERWLQGWRPKQSTQKEEL